MIARIGRFLAVIIIVGALAGCATATPQNPDPYMGFNEGVYRFNMDFNKAFLWPVTSAYRDTTPSFVRTGIGNFFSNVATVPDIINDLLQGNWRYLLKDSARLFLNTTLGLFGFVDVATNSGLPPHQQSFGLTLYKWGLMRHSPYLVLPFLGPSTVRNAIGLVPDYFMNPLSYYRPIYIRYTLKGIELLQKATTTLPKLRFITKDAINPYVALRNAYLQNQKLVIKQIMTDGQYKNGESEPEVPLSFSEHSLPPHAHPEKERKELEKSMKDNQSPKPASTQPENGTGEMSPLMQELQQQQSTTAK